jgi:hypothetical protein
MPADSTSVDYLCIGRPAFVVFDTVGSVEAIAEAHALIETWGLRKLEVSLLLLYSENETFEMLILRKGNHFRRNTGEFEHLWSVAPVSVHWRDDCG